MTNEWWKTAGTVVGASVLSSLVTAAVVLTWVGPRASVAALEPAPVTADGRVEKLLDRVSAQLDRDWLSSPQAPIARRHATELESTADQALDLKNLEHLLDRVAEELAERRVRVALPVGSPPPLPRDLAINVAAITDQGAFFAADPEGALRALRLLTPLEVLERFGSPTRVMGTNIQGYDMGWCWDEPHVGALAVYFTGGYVLYSETHQPN